MPGRRRQRRFFLWDSMDRNLENWPDWVFRFFFCVCFFIGFPRLLYFFLLVLGLSFERAASLGLGCFRPSDRGCGSAWGGSARPQFGVGGRWFSFFSLGIIRLIQWYVSYHYISLIDLHFLNGLKPPTWQELLSVFSFCLFTLSSAAPPQSVCRLLECSWDLDLMSGRLSIDVFQLLGLSGIQRIPVVFIPLHFCRYLKQCKYCISVVFTQIELAGLHWRCSAAGLQIFIHAFWFSPQLSWYICMLLSVCLWSHV